MTTVKTCPTCWVRWALRIWSCDDPLCPGQRPKKRGGK
jgi:hypothetical protein